MSKPKLTRENWKTIYDVLDGEKDRPPIAGDPEWTKYFEQIIETIGPDGENMTEEEDNRAAMLDAIDEADTAFAVINMCDDLTPQAKSALREAWAKVQAILVKLSPDGALAEAVKETPTSAYNLMNPSKEAQDQFPLEDWQYEVMNGDTKRGYNEWLAVQLEDCQHTL